MNDYDWSKYEHICLHCGGPADNWIGCGCLINMKTYVFGYCNAHYRYGNGDSPISPAAFAEKKEMICSDHEDRQSHYFEEYVIVEKP